MLSSLIVLLLTLQNKAVINIMSDISTLIIGAKGTIGAALVKAYEGDGALVTLSRDDIDYSEGALADKSQLMKEEHVFTQIICCIGTLHDDVVQPEKSLKELNKTTLEHYFYVNSVLPALVIKYFAPLLNKTTVSRFVCLSAMVGSTADNQLGGWYGYRASKAALNSLVKTASIELKRTHKNSVLAAIHPGTTVGELTAPFAKNIAPSKYYTPEQTAQRIKGVVTALKPEQSGSFLNWDGKQLPW